MNKEQYRAVHAEVSTPLCVKAGPGSGKTFTLIERVKHISSISKSNRILILAFSKSAVMEIRSRLLTDLNNIDHISIVTFHSFGYKVVTNFHTVLGFSRAPRICSQKQIITYLNDILMDAGNLFKINQDCLAPTTKSMLAAFKLAKTRTNPLKYLYQLCECQPDKGNELISVFKTVQAKLQLNKLIDLDEIIYLAYKICRKQPDVLTILQQTCCSYVLVDEFQDLNEIQLQLLLLLGSHGRSTVVGDFNQLIYSFQGASSANFTAFLMHYERKNTPVTLVQLKINYRSCPAVVIASNEIANYDSCTTSQASDAKLLHDMVSIHALSFRTDLKTLNPLNQSAPIHIIECLPDQNSLFHFVGNRISTLLSLSPHVGCSNDSDSGTSNNIQPNEIAILYRQNVTGGRITSYFKAHFPRILLSRLNRVVSEEDAEEDAEQRKQNILCLVISWLKLALNQSDDDACAVCMSDFSTWFDDSVRIESKIKIRVRDPNEDKLNLAAMLLELRTGRNNVNRSTPRFLCNSSQSTTLFGILVDLVEANTSSDAYSYTFENSSESISATTGRDGQKKRHLCAFFPPMSTNAMQTSEKFTQIKTKICNIRGLSDRINSNKETLPRLVQIAVDNLGVIQQEILSEKRRQLLINEKRYRTLNATIHSRKVLAQAAHVRTDFDSDCKGSIVLYLNSLLAEAAIFDSANKFLTNRNALHHFIQHMESSGTRKLNLESKDISTQDGSGDMASQIIWMGTVHAAKGKEWKYVFLIDGNASTYNHCWNTNKSIHYDMNHRCNEKYSSDGCKDSKNLVYVAVSRAKLYLTITYVGQTSSSPTDLSIYLRPLLKLIERGLVTLTKWEYPVMKFTEKQSLSRSDCEKISSGTQI